MSKLHLVNKSFCLEKICESNYQKLFTLIPQITQIKESAIGAANVPLALHLSVIDRAPYTLTLELSHCFEQHKTHAFEPAVNIKVYLDAQMVEVIRHHERPHVFQAIKSARHSIAIRDYKWSLNYFLGQWLDHCLKNNYYFNNTEQPANI